MSRKTKRKERTSVSLPNGVSRDDAISLYRRMAQARALDALGARMQRDGEISFYVPSEGSEARSVGVAFALGDEDWFFPSFRDLGGVLTRGVEPDAIVAHWRGDVAGAKGRLLPFQYSSSSAQIFPPSSSPSARILQAAGAAHAMRLKGAPSDPKSNGSAASHPMGVVLVSCGESAIGSGELYSGLTFAHRVGAPLVIVVEVGATQRPSVVPLAEACGARGRSIDGSDATAVLLAARAEIAAARSGKGPTVLEVVRPTEPTDPVAKLRKLLIDASHWSDESERECHDGIDFELAEAMRRSATSPSRLVSCFDDVYADAPKRLQDQRRTTEQRTTGEATP